MALVHTFLFRCFQDGNLTNLFWALLAGLDLRQPPLLRGDIWLSLAMLCMTTDKQDSGVVSAGSVEDSDLFYALESLERSRRFPLVDTVHPLESRPVLAY